MSKHEAPPFRMVIEGGKLVPATPYDAERLDTYRRGTKVAVRFTEEKDRILVRKWWAVLGLVVKQCQTPWKTKDEASEAIKLALGIVNLTKTVGGDYLAYPKSLTELDDPELQEAVDQMMALVQRVTGVDPDTLRKEIAHVGEDDNPQSAVSSPADEGSDGEATPPSQTVAADNSQMQPPAGETIRATQDGGMESAPVTGQSPVGAASPSLSADVANPGAGDIGAGHSAAALPAPVMDEKVWLRSFAKGMLAAVGPDEQVVINQSKALFVEGLSDETRKKARSIVNYTRALSRNEIERGDALDMIAGIAGCEARELV